MLETAVKASLDLNLHKCHIKVGSKENIAKRQKKDKSAVPGFIISALIHHFIVKIKNCIKIQARRPVRPGGIALRQVLLFKHD